VAGCSWARLSWKMRPARSKKLRPPLRQQQRHWLCRHCARRSRALGAA